MTNSTLGSGQQPGDGKVAVTLDEQHAYMAHGAAQAGQYGSVNPESFDWDDRTGIASFDTHMPIADVVQEYLPWAGMGQVHIQTQGAVLNVTRLDSTPGNMTGSMGLDDTAPIDRTPGQLGSTGSAWSDTGPDTMMGRGGFGATVANDPLSGRSSDRSAGLGSASTMSRQDQHTGLDADLPNEGSPKQRHSANTGENQAKPTDI